LQFLALRGSFSTPYVGSRSSGVGVSTAVAAMMSRMRSPKKSKDRTMKLLKLGDYPTENRTMMKTHLDADSFIQKIFLSPVFSPLISRELCYQA
jgi:ABC-type metal ion transport system substrate-binding protein